MLQKIQLPNARFLYATCPFQQVSSTIAAPVDWVQSWELIERTIEGHPQWERANSYVILHFKTLPTQSDFTHTPCLVGREIIGLPTKLEAGPLLMDTNQGAAWEMPLHQFQEWEQIFQQVKTAYDHLLNKGQELRQEWRIKIILDQQVVSQVSIMAALQFFPQIGTRPMLQNPFGLDDYKGV